MNTRSRDAITAEHVQALLRKIEVIIETYDNSHNEILESLRNLVHEIESGCDKSHPFDQYVNLLKAVNACVVIPEFSALIQDELSCDEQEQWLQVLKPQCTLMQSSTNENIKELRGKGWSFAKSKKNDLSLDRTRALLINGYSFVD